MWSMTIKLHAHLSLHVTVSSVVLKDTYLYCSLLDKEFWECFVWMQAKYLNNK